MQPRLVLLRPRNADNLVAIAATMARHGWTEWVLVSEQVHLDNMREVLRKHREPTPFAEHVERARRVDSLKQALEGCTWVVGTSMRAFSRKPRFTARELAAEVRARGEAPWALVFGAEANGMTLEDVAPCDALSYLPSSEEQPSLNLAQAVLLYAYELSLPSRLNPQLVASMHAKFGAHEAEALLAPLERASLTEAEQSGWIAALKEYGVASRDAT
ncbi:MAG: RNA methyltransferase [Archangium sp.]